MLVCRIGTKHGCTMYCGAAVLVVVVPPADVASANVPMPCGDDDDVVAGKATEAAPMHWHPSLSTPVF